MQVAAEKIPASGVLSSYDHDKREGIVTLGSMKGEARLSYDLLNKAGFGRKVVVGSKIDCGVRRAEDGTLDVVTIIQCRFPRHKQRST